MPFKGWPAEAIEFFEHLEADNSKSFWQAHKDVYDTCVKAPMEALVTDLADEFGPGKIFRPNRDVRFSADKSPYKTNIAAMIGDAGYVQVNRDGLGAGAGYWMMASDQLSRYRAAVDDGTSGGELVGVVAAAGKAGVDITGHDVLKTAPKGYPKDHPRFELLKYKGLIAWKSWPVAAWLGTAAAKKRVVDFLHTTQPLRDWLAANVGASTEPIRER